jgi:hypothetical protein
MTDLVLAGSIINPIYDIKNIELIGTYMLGGSPTIITRVFDNKLDKYIFYSHRLDTEKMVFLEPVKIFERFVTEGSSRARSAFGEVNVFSSEDGNFMVVSYNDITEEISEDDATKKKFNQKLNLFNRAGELVAASVFELPYEQFNITQKALSSEGVVYMIGFAYSGDSNAGNRKRKDYLVSFDIEKEVRQEVEIIIEDNYSVATNLHLFLSKNGDIQISGITSLKTAEDKITYGCLLSKFDKSLIQSAAHQSKLETDFAGSGFSVKKIINRPDGSSVVLAEKFYTKSQTSTNSSGIQSTITSYHFDDILAVSCNSAGDVEWIKVIEKRQLTKGSDQNANLSMDPTRFSSFCALVDDDRVHIIYNQPKAYYDDPIGAKVTALKMVDKESEIIVATLDSEGNLSKKRMLDSGNEICVVTNSFRTLTNGTAYFCGTSLSEEQIFSIVKE